MRELDEAERLVAAFVGSFRPECWHGRDAAALVAAFDRIERLAAAGKVLAARRAEATENWKAQGHATPEEWLADTTGTSVSAASETLATGRRLEACPATVEALRAGELSASQAALVASGASADRSAEQRLLDDAARGSHAQLRRSARAARAAARAGRAVDVAAIHRSRYLRHWTAEDGALEGRFRLTPDHGATLVGALRHFHHQVFDAARTAGDREDPDCYEADALVAMARTATGGGGGGDSADPSGDGPGRDGPGCDGPGSGGPGSGGPGSGGGGGRGPGVAVHVRVDRSALVRGHTVAGETCEIDGIGPVPVAVVERLMGDAVVWAVLVDGERIIDVRHAGRTLPERLRVALVERDRHCAVPGCGRRFGLEIHHLVPWAAGGLGSLDNLARLCPHHHDLITYRGARLTGTWPTWTWTPPPDKHPPDQPGPFDDPPDHHPDTS